jgi:hypothetical protein
MAVGTKAEEEPQGWIDRAWPYVLGMFRGIIIIIFVFGGLSLLKWLRGRV